MVHFALMRERNGWWGVLYHIAACASAYIMLFGSNAPDRRWSAPTPPPPKTCGFCVIALRLSFTCTICHHAPFPVSLSATPPPHPHTYTRSAARIRYALCPRLGPARPGPPADNPRCRHRSLPLPLSSLLASGCGRPVQLTCPDMRMFVCVHMRACVFPIGGGENRAYTGMSFKNPVASNGI